MTRGLAVAALAAALGLGACGGDGRGADAAVADPLAWAATPQVGTPEQLPRDRVLNGKLRNTAREPVTLRTGDVTVLDADGRALSASVAFLGGFVRSLEPYNRGRPPSQLPASEQRRLGREVRIEPDQVVPVTVSWTEPAGRQAERIDYGEGTLSLPSGRR